MGDLPDRGRDRIADNDQIVISVQRELVRIERAHGHLRRSRQLFGKEARHGKIARCQRGRLEEATPCKVTTRVLYD